MKKLRESIKKSLRNSIAGSINFIRFLATETSKILSTQDGDQIKLNR